MHWTPCSVQSPLEILLPLSLSQINKSNKVLQGPGNSMLWFCHFQALGESESGEVEDRVGTGWYKITEC